MFEQIEKVKQEYTDKYVKVDPNRAELARFKDLVGQVKTVNMSGRALVEFLGYHLNIGWYDIDLDYLKVVDKPAPKLKEEKQPAAKEAAPKKDAPAAAKKLSPLEMARQADSGKAKPAAGAKKSTADVLAALRSGDSGKPAAKPAEAKAESAPAKPAAEEAPAAEAAAPAAEAASPGPAGAVDKSGMSIDEMVAYCREKDA